MSWLGMTTPILPGPPTERPVKHPGANNIDTQPEKGTGSAAKKPPAKPKNKPTVKPVPKRKTPKPSVKRARKRKTPKPSPRTSRRKAN